MPLGIALRLGVGKEGEREGVGGRGAVESGKEEEGGGLKERGGGGGRRGGVGRRKGKSEHARACTYKYKCIYACMHICIYNITTLHSVSYLYFPILLPLPRNVIEK